MTVLYTRKRRIRLIIISIIGLLLIAYISIYIKIRSHISELSDFKIVNQDKIEIFLRDTMTDPEFLFLGNSITEGFDLQKHFGKPYVNRGIGGNTTEAILFRLDEVIRRNPQNIILMIGVNDISRGVDEEEILDNYRQILDRIQNALPGIRIYTLSVLPVRDNFDLRRLAINTAYWMTFVRPYDMNPSIIALNQKISVISEDAGVTYFDIHSYFLEEKDDLQLNSSLAVDNVHLNEKGYALLTQLLRERIDGI